MAALCRGPKGGLFTPFGLGLLTFILAPNAIGSQELAALIARQAVVAERPSSRFSLVGTAHGATFNFNMPRPISAAMPASLSYTLAGLDSSYADLTGSIRERLLGDTLPDELAMPVPDRRRKGDRLPLVQNAEPPAGEVTEAEPEIEPNTPHPMALASIDRNAVVPTMPNPSALGAAEILAPQDERGAAAEFQRPRHRRFRLRARGGRSGRVDGAALFQRRADERDPRSDRAVAGGRTAEGRDLGGFG